MTPVHVRLAGLLVEGEGGFLVYFPQEVNCFNKDCEQDPSIGPFTALPVVPRKSWSRPVNILLNWFSAPHAAKEKKSYGVPE